MIGNRIKEILKEKQMTMYRLSKITGISASYISEMISGKYNNPSADILQKLSTALGVSVTKLLKKAS